VNSTTVIVIDILHRGAVAVIRYVVEYLGTGNVTANEAIQEDILVSVGWVFVTLRWSPVARKESSKYPTSEYRLSSFNPNRYSFAIFGIYDSMGI